MSRDIALAVLLRMTHGWHPRDDAAASLRIAREAIALALLFGQPEPLTAEESLPPPADLGTDIRNQIADAIAASANELARSQPSVPARVFVRPTPILSHHDSTSVPAWAANRARVTSIGPFVDDLDCEWWVDLYDDHLPHVTFARSAQSTPIVLVPHESAYRSHDRVELAEGTVWLAARLFANDAPAGFVGLPIVQGSLTLDGPTQGSGPIVLDPQGSISLDLELAPQTPPVQGIPHAALPERVTIHVSPGGIDEVSIDSGSIELGGQVWTLERRDAPTRYEAALSSVFIPCELQSNGGVSAVPPISVCTLAGTARWEGGGWAIPVTHAAYEDLGQAAETGALVLVAGPGVTATWNGLLGGPARLGRSFGAVSANLLSIVAPEAENRRNAISVAMWDEKNTARRSSLDIRFRQPHALKLFKSSEDDEAIVASALVATRIDRPLYATGQRPGYARRNTIVRWLQRVSVVRLQILSAIASPSTFAMIPGPAAVRTLAIENALMRISPARSLLVSGVLDNESGIPSGGLALLYGLQDIVPFLPDPYTANLDTPPIRRTEELTGVVAFVRWEMPTLPDLRLSLFDIMVRTPASRVALPNPRPAIQPHSDGDDSSRLRNLFAHTTGSPPEVLRLLDLSGNADRLGVGVNVHGERASQDFTVRDLRLQTEGRNLRVLMLPQVQWEPVITPPSPVPGFPVQLNSVDDGGPSAIASNSVQLVPISPVPLADEIVHDLRGRRVSGAALFTLPFGIKAVATFPRLAWGQPPLSTLGYVRPEFGSLTGARQFRIEATFDPRNGQTIPGASLQLTNAAAFPGSTRISVLDNNPDGSGFSTRHMFNSLFGPGGNRAGAPISRMDLSGYGESGVSHWRNESPWLGASIVKVRLDVFGGRTAYEVVQEVSLCWPNLAVFVRTITLERKGNAQVIRSDSGWDQAKPGLFRNPSFDGVFHTGVVKGYYNITAIREVGAPFSPSPGVLFQPVLFNADLAMERVTAGHRGTLQDANSETAYLVPVRDVVGYLQRLPEQIISSAQLAALFASKGPIGSHVDCEIDIGDSGLRMSVTGAFAEPVGGNEFAVAARGMPRMPSGQWSFTRTDNAMNGAEENEPQAVDRSRGLPLVRHGAASLPSSANASAYRFADPADLNTTAPAFDYSILFETEVFRVLYVRPTIEVDSNHVGLKKITSPIAPVLADPYALVSTSGLFPKARHCLRFPGPTSIDILPGNHLRFPNVGFKVAPLRTREQVKTANWRMTMEYADEDGRLTEVKVGLDSTATPPATLDMAPVSVVVDTGPFKGLMRVVGDLQARSPATVTNAEVVLGSAMAPVGDFITVLRDFGLPIAMLASIGASDEKALIFKQTVHIDIIELLRKLHVLAEEAPKKPRDKVAEFGGIGKVGGAIDVGIFISLSGRAHAGVFLKVEGELQQLIIPVGNTGLYAGGHLALEFAFEMDEEEKDGKKEIKEQSIVELTAAVVGSVGGDLITVPRGPHKITLLEGEATVRKGYVIEIDLNTGVFKPGVMIGMEIEAEVLAGIVGVGLEWEGKGLITRKADKLLVEAEVTIAATLTLAIFFEASIEIEGQYEVELDKKVVAGLLIAFGVIPV